MAVTISRRTRLDRERAIVLALSTDEDLLQQWRAGDTHAGEQLFERHFDSIYGFFETKFASEADELTQATFLTCVSAKDRFRHQSSFRTFLFAIARHELYHRLRSFQRKDAKLDFEVSSIVQLVSTPGTKLARNTEHRRLIATLQQMPVEQQTLLELHYWQGMEPAELAEVFDCPAATIRTRLHRARKTLKELLELEGSPTELASLETMDEWARKVGK